MKKKYAVVFGFLIVGIGIIVYHFRIMPQKAVRGVLDQIAFTSLYVYEVQDFEKLENHVRDGFSDYFTEKGYEESVSHRYFSAFFNPGIQKKDIEVKDVSLSFYDWERNDATLGGTFTEKYSASEGANEKVWNINARLLRSGGKWKIDAFRIK